MLRASASPAGLLTSSSGRSLPRLPTCPLLSAPKPAVVGSRASIVPRSLDYISAPNDTGVLKLASNAELNPSELKNVFGFPRDFHEKYYMGPRIGSGSFGVVHECYLAASGDVHAVKRVGKAPKRGKCTPRYLLKLRAEVEIMQQLGSSLDAVNLQDVFEDDDFVYMVMELCLGGELLQRIEKATYSEKYIATLVRGMLRFISQCHAKGYIYRDVKPDNFLFLSDKEDSPLKATDFGLAIQHGPDEPKLSIRSGTPAYMAPELVQQHYDEKCDIWSVGMVTYQLLTGRFPYWEDVRQYTLNDVWRTICDEEINWDAEELKNLSSSAVDFLRFLLQREPQDRPSAADALTHPWVREEGSAEESPLVSTVVQRLQRFSTYGRLKQKVLQMIFDDMQQDYMASHKDKAFVQSVQELFASIDTDGSGGIDLEELKEGLRKHGYTLSDAEVKQMQERIDFDHSGDIDLNELMVTLMDWGMVQQENSWMKYLEKTFDKLDLNGNGLIELDELVALLTSDPHSIASMEDTMAEAKRMIREVDTNGDGEISREEFYRMLQDSWAQDALGLYASRRNGDVLTPAAATAAA